MSHANQKCLIFHIVSTSKKCGKLYPHIYIIYFYLFISFSISKYKYRDSFVDKKYVLILYKKLSKNTTIT